MTYSIEFSKNAQKTIGKWKKSNPIAFKKLKELIPELASNPRTGKGHPEPMKGGENITYSRHITAHDRIIYDILMMKYWFLLLRWKDIITINKRKIL